MSTVLVVSDRQTYDTTGSIGQGLQGYNAWTRARNGAV